MDAAQEARRGRTRMLPRLLISLGILGLGIGLAACGDKSDEAPAAGGTGEAATPATSAPATTGSWTPEALEELLAPVALYPDVVLGHVLIASTNPQEVLDAGNW